MRKLYTFFIWTGNFIIYKLWWVLNAVPSHPGPIAPIPVSRFLSGPPGFHPTFTHGQALKARFSGAGLPTERRVCVPAQRRTVSLLLPFSFSRNLPQTCFSHLQKEKSLFGRYFSLAWFQLFVFLYLKTCLQTVPCIYCCNFSPPTEPT